MKLGAPFHNLIFFTVLLILPRTICSIKSLNSEQISEHSAEQR